MHLLAAEATRSSLYAAVFAACAPSPHWSRTDRVSHANVSARQRWLRSCITRSTFSSALFANSFWFSALACAVHEFAENGEQRSSNSSTRAGCDAGQSREHLFVRIMTFVCRICGYAYALNTLMRRRSPARDPARDPLHLFPHRGMHIRVHMHMHMDSNLQGLLVRQVCETTQPLARSPSRVSSGDRRSGRILVAPSAAGCSPATRLCKVALRASTGEVGLAAASRP